MAPRRPPPRGEPGPRSPLLASTPPPRPAPAPSEVLPAPRSFPVPARPPERPGRISARPARAPGATRAPSLRPPSPGPPCRSHAPRARQPDPHSPSCGAASLPLLPPDGSRAAPSRASAPAGRAASRPAAATSSRSRRWLTEKFLRAWAQSPGPSAAGGGGPGPSAGLSRAKAAAALSMSASRPGVPGRVAGGVAASAPRRRALPGSDRLWLRGRPARSALASGDQLPSAPALLLARSQVAKTRAAPATRPLLMQTSPGLSASPPRPSGRGQGGGPARVRLRLGAGRRGRSKGVALRTHTFRSGKLKCFVAFCSVLCFFFPFNPPTRNWGGGRGGASSRPLHLQIPRRGGGATLRQLTGEIWTLLAPPHSPCASTRSPS